MRTRSDPAYAQLGETKAKTANTEGKGLSQQAQQEQMYATGKAADAAAASADLTNNGFFFKLVSGNMAKHTLLGDMSEALNSVDIIVKRQLVSGVALHSDEDLAGRGTAQTNLTHLMS